MRYKNADWHVQPIHKLIVEAERSRPDIWWTVEPYGVPAGVAVDNIIGGPPTPGGHATPTAMAAMATAEALGIDATP